MIDVNLLYGACVTESAIVEVVMVKDGVGLRGTIRKIYSYEMPCKSVSSIAIVDKLLFFVTADGIKNLDLENPQASAVVVNNEKDNFYPYQVKKMGHNVLFSNPINRKLFIFDQDSASIHAFAGNGNESSVDGPLADCSFRQPLGIAVEFDNVIYLTDAMSRTVNIISPIKNTVAFLDAVGCL